MPGPAEPVVSFDPTKTAYIGKSKAVFTPTGGAAVNIIGKLVDCDFKTDIVERKVPDANGVLRADRIVGKDAQEHFIFADLEEVDQVLTIMGGLTGVKKGTVQLFAKDPDDAVNTVKYLTDVFACTVIVKGPTKLGGGDFSKMSLVFMSTKGSAVTITTNAPVT